MFSPQNRLKVKPYPIPKSPHSANSSPRASRSNEFSSNEKFPLSPKPGCSLMLKTLDDLSCNFQSAIKKPCKSEKDLMDLIQNCEKTVKMTRLKVMEAGNDGKNEGSSGLSGLNGGPLPKTSNDEYSAFLEYLLVYEQKKNEVILDKAKFPKVRMKEVERALNDEFGLKPTSISNTNKLKELSFCDMAKRELREIYTKITKNLKETANFEVIQDKNDEKSETFQFLDEKKKISQFIQEGNSFLQASVKAQEETHRFRTDLEKITVKYNYLICRFNKQDSTLKSQSKILAVISNETYSLKLEVLALISEFRDFFNNLVDTLSKKSFSRLSGMEMYEQQKQKWKAEKEEMLKEIKENKEKTQTLEKKQKKSLEEIVKLKSQLESKNDETLELNSNINDIIEIQKLKDQLRLLTFKLNDSNDLFRREQETFMENISRLKEENLVLQSKLKALTQKLDLKCDEDKAGGYRLKPLILIDPPRTPLQTSMETISVGEVSSEQSVKINDLFELLKEDIEEIAQSLRFHQLFPGFIGNNVDIIRKSSNFLIKLKENLCLDSHLFEETLESLVLEHRKKMFSKESSVNKTAADSHSFIRDKEIEEIKEKLNGRKGQIGLLKLQINYLKETIRNLKSELKKTNSVDFECIKVMIFNVLKEIPRLPADTENLLLALMDGVELTAEEINQVRAERKGKRGIF